MTISRSKALVALGANLPSATGSPRQTLEEALRLIGESDAEITGKARWRRTPAFPAGSGPDFVNGAAVIETAMDAASFLALLHEVEAVMGRTRDKRWEPRLCDLDLIAFDDMIAPNPERLTALMAMGPVVAGAAPPPDEMILPHPRMQERAFVLAPLVDIAPEWRHPLTGVAIRDMLAALPASARAEIEVLDD